MAQCFNEFDKILGFPVRIVPYKVSSDCWKFLERQGNHTVYFMKRFECFQRLDVLGEFLIEFVNSLGVSGCCVRQAKNLLNVGFHNFAFLSKLVFED